MHFTTFLNFYNYAITDTPDEQTGGDSSKSNSITSEHSIHSMGVSASSQSSSTNSLPLPNADGNDYSSGSVRNRHKVSAGGVTANLLEHGANNFATIRTTSIVTKQQKEHMQEEMHEQMSGYKRMRREHQGALVRIQTLSNIIMDYKIEERLNEKSFIIIDRYNYKFPNLHCVSLN